MHAIDKKNIYEHYNKTINRLSGRCVASCRIPGTRTK